MPPVPTRSRRALLALTLLAACGEVETDSADAFRKTGELIALSGGHAGASNACFTCHGLDGAGNGAGAPRLAGLDAGYMERQLAAYADGRRRHPEMEWIARRLPAADRQAVSSYYAGLSFEPRIGAPAGIGGRLYRLGDPKRGLLPCAACHGGNGEGLGPANPPLGGQPAPYLAEQMRKWQASERRNDPANIMLAIALRLTPAEVEAVSAYAAALPAGPPRPESPEASRAARRDGPRNGASAPPPRGAE